MDAFSDPTVRRVVLKWSAQTGKTTIIKAVIGYHIDKDPAPLLVVQPTLEMAEVFSKDRLAPMVRDTPALKNKIADARSRDSGNTLLHKRFPGGHVSLAGANSAAGLASRPIRKALCDETDRYPASAGTEGDPVNLAEKRTATFWNSTLGLFSTPTREGQSRIDIAYRQTDQRKYFVPCPHCDEFHVLEWANVRYPEGKPDEAVMVCPECGEQITDADKPGMLAPGEWRATAEATIKGARGYQINELYSPWRTFGDVARAYEAAKDSPEQLKTWVNTSLGECYEDKGEAPEWQRLYDRREDYPSNLIPAGVAFLTMGVDVQGDRLECEVVGWAPGKRSYQIDYRVIVGDTADLGSEGPWAKLQAIINTEQWECQAGPTMGIKMACVDSGFRTATVYEFCRRFPFSKCAPIKGRDDQAFIISPPRAIDRRRDGKAARGIKIYHVGSSVAKVEFYGLLRLDKAEDGSSPPGYCYFNQDRDQQFFKELTSEKEVTKMVRGFPRPVWVKDPHIRNEPLDCRVYARAAAAICGMDRWREKDWDALTSRPSAPPPVKVQASEPEQARAVNAPTPPKPRQSSVYDRWRR